MVFIEKDSFRNLRRLPTDAFRSIPRLPLEDLVLPVAASDLVAWYPFRAGTGEDITAGDSRFGDATDYSAVVNGPTFKPSGGTTDIQTGANSGAFDFDGTDDTLGLGTVADSDQSLTVMAWVNTDNATKEQRIISKADDGNFTSGMLAIDIANFNPRFFVFDNSAFPNAESFNQITANQFTHVAGRFDFPASEITVFVNGQPKGTGTADGTVAQLSSQPWRIGEDKPNTEDEHLDGTVDDARIYQAALSDSQINQIYLNTQP